MNPALTLPSIVDGDPDDLVRSDQTPSVDWVAEPADDAGAAATDRAAVVADAEPGDVPREDPPAKDGPAEDGPTEDGLAEDGLVDEPRRGPAQVEPAPMVSAPVDDRLPDEVVPPDYVADYDDDQSSGFDDDGVDQRVPFT